MKFTIIGESSMVDRGDVVLIPFPFTDFSALKTQPAVIISSKLLMFHLKYRLQPHLLFTTLDLFNCTI
jgi:hypothetical protein